MTIENFRNKATEDIAKKVRSVKAAALIPLELHARAHKRLVMLDNTTAIKDLEAWSSTNLLRDRHIGFDYYSIDIDERFMIRFRWCEDRAKEVEIVDGYMESLKNK